MLNKGFYPSTPILAFISCLDINKIKTSKASMQLCVYTLNYTWMEKDRHLCSELPLMSICFSVYFSIDVSRTDKFPVLVQYNIAPRIINHAPYKL